MCLEAGQKWSAGDSVGDGGAGLVWGCLEGERRKGTAQ